MKPTDTQRSELLNELYPESESISVEAADVLRWVADERNVQRRRRQYASGIIATVLGACLFFILPSRREAIVDQTPRTAEPQPNAPMVTAAPKPAAIERIDDDALLGLMDDTPAALVQWPDGRRSLLVVVKTQTPR